MDDSRVQLSTMCHRTRPQEGLGICSELASLLEDRCSGHVPFVSLEALFCLSMAVLPWSPCRLPLLGEGPLLQTRLWDRVA